MREEQCGDLTLWRFDLLAEVPRLAHAVAGRPHNFAPHRGPQRQQALRWRQEVCRILGLPFERLTSPAQVHGPDVLAVEDGDIGRGRDGRESAVPHVDGLITDRPGVPLVLLSADCPLVCAYDPDRPAVGAVHASWKGTVAGAAARLVEMMVRTFGSRPERLVAAVAPGAGPCCYEVGHDVRRLARTRLEQADRFFIERDGRLFFDLWEANRRQLIDAGVPAAAIEVAGLCSICDRRFWSHRREGPDTGRTALFIGLRD